MNVFVQSLSNVDICMLVISICVCLGAVGYIIVTRLLLQYRCLHPTNTTHERIVGQFLTTDTNNDNAATTNDNSLKQEEDDMKQYHFISVPRFHHYFGGTQNTKDTISHHANLNTTPKITDDDEEESHKEEEEEDAVDVEKAYDDEDEEVDDVEKVDNVEKEDDGEAANDEDDKADDEEDEPVAVAAMLQEDANLKVSLAEQHCFMSASSSSISIGSSSISNSGSERLECHVISMAAPSISSLQNDSKNENDEELGCCLSMQSLSNYSSEYSSSGNQQDDACSVKSSSSETCSSGKDACSMRSNSSTYSGGYSSGISSAHFSSCHWFHQPNGAVVDSSPSEDTFDVFQVDVNKLEQPLVVPLEDSSKTSHSSSFLHEWVKSVQVVSKERVSSCSTISDKTPPMTLEECNPSVAVAVHDNADNREETITEVTGDSQLVTLEPMPPNGDDNDDDDYGMDV